jgi:hypothetical protein
MEFWRRWRLLSVIALVGVVSQVALGAGLDEEVAALQGAKGTAAVAAREAIVGPGKSMSLVSRDSYGATVASKLAPLLAKPEISVDARLNAAIAIAEMHTLSTDKSLEGMLKNAAPEVRYWGAKGLGGIMPDLGKVGGQSLRDAVNGLLTALKTEKSGIIKTQMIEALGKTNDLRTVLQGVDVLTAQIAAGTTDTATLDAAAAALTQLDTAIRAAGAGGMSKGDTSAAAKSVAWMASDAAQQQVALSEKASAEQSEMPEGYASSTANVVSTAVKALNDLAGRGTFKGPAGDESPDALQLMVDGLTGTPGTGQGELQKTMPDVPVPPAIKK